MRAWLSFDRVRDRRNCAAEVGSVSHEPVENYLGWFGDVPYHAQSVWESYLTVPAKILSRGQAAFNYIGLDTNSVTYNQGTSLELRHTVGTGVFRPIGTGLDYNCEANYQWGNFGSASILAWTVSTETGFTLDRLRFHPRPLLRPDVYSGDRNPASQILGTFNSLFPRGAYFSPKAVPFLGPPESDRFVRGAAISDEDELYGRFFLELVLARIGVGRDICIWEQRLDRSGRRQPRLATSAIREIARFAGLPRPTPSSHSTSPVSSQELFSKP